MRPYVKRVSEAGPVDSCEYTRLSLDYTIVDAYRMVGGNYAPVAAGELAVGTFC